MKWFPSLSSRIRLLLALAILPLFADALIRYSGERAAALARAESMLRERLHSVTEADARLLAGSREALRLLAGADALPHHDPAACSASARRLREAFPDYVDFGAVLPDGRILCSVPAPRQPAAAGAPWFRDAAAAGGRMRGHYARGPASGGPGVIFALPSLAADGSLQAVAYADAGAFWRRAAAAGVQALLLSVDGKPASGEGPAPWAAAGAGGNYLLATAPLAATGGEYLAALAVPKALVTADADRDFRERLLVLVLAAGLAWLVARQTIKHLPACRADGSADDRERSGAGAAVAASPDERTPAEVGQGAAAALGDVTAVRTLTERLAGHAALLAQAEALAAVGTWSLRPGAGGDLQSGEVFWSDGTCRLFGYAPAEVVPCVDLFLAHVAPEDAERVQEVVAAALAGRPVDRAEFRIRRRDGVERTLVARCECRCDAPGEPPRLVGAVQDVSERKADESEALRQRERLASLVAERSRELAAAAAAAEQACRNRAHFLANVSHELRTPLNSLMLLAHVLSSNSWGNLNSQQLEYARLIESAGSDLGQLIDELLDLAGMEGGRPEVRLRTVPFPDIMQNVRRLYRHVVQSKGLDFRMEIAPDVPAAIATDPLRLQQILRNLIFNAIKFTDAGSVTLRIRRAVSGWRFGHPALSEAGAVIAFDVVDTGCGISPERQGWISGLLGPQATPPAEGGDSGLGLAIAREIAVLLGGELALVSVPGQGSTFTLYLPLEQPADASPSAQRAADGAGDGPLPASAGLAGKRVLVVDGDGSRRAVLGTLLESLGMAVTGAAGGPEAIGLLASEEIDVVLMDVLMPGMDGCQATRAIRAEISRDLPIIALASSDLPGVREDCLASGCNDYLLKPVANARLIDCLHSALAAARRECPSGAARPC